MEYLPIFLEMQHQPCLVVGGGRVAARRVASLVATGAIVTVISPEISPALHDLFAQNKITWRQKYFEASDIQTQRLVIAATNDTSVNHFVYETAKVHGIWGNISCDSEQGDFIFPAVLDRSPILIALSSGGKSPVLSRHLKAKLENMLPEGYRQLAELMGRYRKRVKTQIENIDLRRLFWEKVVDGSIAEHVLVGDITRAEQSINQLLADPEQHNHSQGEVYLVGAGPGDPELLTLKALRLMQQADVVFYDRLVSQPILDRVRQDAELIYVGKQRDWHIKRQEEINQLLVDYALAGKRVLRLKGGDPFIFGRGGEEIASLAERNIPFQVIPGITAASGCACYAGIPLTHRDYAQSCTFVTGQLKAGELDLNWSSLVQPNQTIVVYMGLVGLSVLTEQLKKHGMSPDMPAALVQQGTTPNQKVWVSTIDALPALAEKVQPVAPTLLIIGEVVQLHDSLAWLPDSEN